MAMTCQAQDIYPSRSLTLVVPYAPGGFVDNVARALSAPLQKALRQPVIIVNKAGANGDIGQAFVARSAPDGYTMVLAAPSLAAQPAIDKLFGRKPPYELSELKPIAQLTSDPAIFLVSPALGVKTLKEYVALAKEQPDRASAASSGTYGATHLPVAMLEMGAGIHILHIPTSGGAAALSMTIGGHTNSLMAAPSVALSQVKAGKLVPLAQTGTERLAFLPEVPTFKEAGIDVEFSLWTSLLVPAKTPPAVLDVLREGLRAAAQDTQFRSAVAASYSTVAYRDGAAYDALWAREVERLQGAVRHIGKVESN